MIILRVRGRKGYLVEVGGGQLPCLGGEVDVVAVMHLGQVVEAAGLHTHSRIGLLYLNILLMLVLCSLTVTDRAL